MIEKHHVKIGQMDGMNVTTQIPGSNPPIIMSYNGYHVGG